MCLDTIEACGIVRREAIQAGRHGDRPLQVETIGWMIVRGYNGGHGSLWDLLSQSLTAPLILRYPLSWSHTTTCSRQEAQ